MREYQWSLVEDILGLLKTGTLRIMLALATGAGKTRVAAEIIKALKAQPGDTLVLFVVDRLVLVDQAAEVFDYYGFSVGKIQAENTHYSAHDDVIVCSVQSLRSREIPRGVTLVFIDEAHLCGADHAELFERVEEQRLVDGRRVPRKLPIIGLSATPLTPGLGNLFDYLERGPSIAWLTDRRYLVPVVAYAPGETQLRERLAEVSKSGSDYNQGELSKLFRRDAVIGDAIKTYQRLGEQRPALAFCVDKAHARAVVAEFEAENITAAYILADTPQSERSALLERFAARELQVLVSVAVLSAGFDAPLASCAILLRPTLSQALHMQQVGRVLRSLRDAKDSEQLGPDGLPLKQDALILDHAGNTTRHGLPIDFVVSDLSTELHRPTVSKLRERVDRLATCASCSLVVPNEAAFCPACGADRPKRSSKVIYLDGELIVRHQREEQAKEAERQARIQKAEYSDAEKQEFYLGLRSALLAKGRKPGAAFYQYQDKFKEKPPFAWNDLEPIAPSAEVLRYITHQDIKYKYQRSRERGK